MKENNMDGECNTRGEMINAHGSLVGKPEGKGYLGDERIILKRVVLD
jgi:hypothetical protein